MIIVDYMGEGNTKCHSDRFTEVGVHHLGLLLNLIMIPLERCVATENEV